LNPILQDFSGWPQAGQQAAAGSVSALQHVSISVGQVMPCSVARPDNGLDRVRPQKVSKRKEAEVLTG